MKRHLSALAALTVLLVPVGLEAQDTDWNRYTLQGLGGVFVRAEADAACESAGVTGSSLLAESAVKLIEADVDVLTEQQMLENAGLPAVRITVDCAVGVGNGTAGHLAYGVSVRVPKHDDFKDTLVTSGCPVVKTKSLKMHPMVDLRPCKGLLEDS